MQTLQVGDIRYEIQVVVAEKTCVGIGEYAPKWDTRQTGSLRFDAETAEAAARLAKAAVDIAFGGLE